MNVQNMILVGLLAGLLSSMNFWTIKLSDVKLHVNDLYMALLMVGWMLLFENITNNKSHGGASYNVTIIIVSICIIVSTIFLIRRQTFVTDRQYLFGMIPHHSMAILMSTRILDKTNNPKIAAMANRIIKDQNNEIDEMNQLLREITPTRL